MNTVASLPDRLRFMVADGRNMGVNERTIDLAVLEEAAAALATPAVEGGLPEPVAVKYPDTGLRDDKHALALWRAHGYDTGGEPLYSADQLHSHAARRLAPPEQPGKAFKDYVHQRLDAMGVPVDPESPHKAAGCRIGGRLDWIEQRIAEQPGSAVQGEKCCGYCCPACGRCYTCHRRALDCLADSLTTPPPAPAAEQEK